MISEPGSTLHGILVNPGKILAKIVTRYCQELQDDMVRFYRKSHASQKKMLLRSPIWQEKYLEALYGKKKFLRTA